jgi:pimeloyl-ACP methyl ester carboxylesterase
MNVPLFLLEGAGVAALLYVLYRRGALARFRKGSAKGPAGLEPKRVRAGKTEIGYYLGSKKGPTVMLLHGFGTDKDQWLALVPHLEAAGYHVVVPDMPGFGSNFREIDAKYDATTLARQMRAFAKSIDVGMFHLVGHSVGAIVAASYAYAMPVEVASLTLIEPLGLKAPNQSELDKALARRQNPLIITTPAAYDGFLSLVMHKPPALAAAVKKQRAEALAADRAFYQQVWNEMLGGDRANLLDLVLPELKTRTLAVFGGRSKVVHPITAKVIEKRLEEKEARVVVLPESGHWPMVEQPKELAEELIAFFRAHGRSESRSAVGD